MYKFRTMVDGLAGAGPRVTAADDPRITRLGRFLRNTKINELPQLINVLKGEMSLVGPRPEDPEFVAHYSPEERQVLSVRPGITSPAAIGYRDEEAMLSYRSAAHAYLRDILPSKLRLDLLYVQRRSFLLDLDVLLRTCMVLMPTLRREATQVAAVFVGPIQRLVREQLPWFLLDSATALGGVALAGLIWRASHPLDLGLGRSLLAALGLAIAFSLTNRLLGLQRTAWHYASAQEALDILLSSGLATALLAGTNQVLTSPLPPGMLLLAGFFALAGFVAVRYRSRLLAGLWHRLAPSLTTFRDGRERVLVVGGGEAGQLMVWMLQNGAGTHAFHVVGVIDDDFWKRGARIHRVRVLGDRTSIPQVVREQEVDLIVFAIHNIDPATQELIIAICRTTPARVVVMPDMVALLAREGQASRHKGACNLQGDESPARPCTAGCGYQQMPSDEPGRPLVRHP
jgi:hypothetical protein